MGMFEDFRDNLDLQIDSSKEINDAATWLQAELMDGRYLPYKVTLPEKVATILVEWALANGFNVVRIEPSGEYEPKVEIEIKFP